MATVPTTAKQQQAAAEEWISKAEAMKRFVISDRQLSRYMADGRVEKRRLPRPPGEAVAPVILKVSDLARLQVSREEGERMRNQVPTRIVLPVAPPPVLQLAPPAEEAEDASYTPEPRRPPRIWCTIAEAARWSGLSEGFIRRGVLLGEIEAVDMGEGSKSFWRIKRNALATLKGRGEGRTSGIG